MKRCVSEYFYEAIHEGWLHKWWDFFYDDGSHEVLETKARIS